MTVFPLAGSGDVATDAPPHLFEVRNLTVDFRRSGHPPVRAVDGVSYHLDAGETLVLLGESGSGKSVSSLAAMGLLDPPPAATVGGSVRLDGMELLDLDRDRWSKVRGPRIAMVFQDALSALNPCLSVGFQISETLRAHLPVNRKQAKAGAVELMNRVRIPDAARRVGDFPHQFSGGMRQRIMIAMAIAAEPEILIADEPTTALDVTVQAQIMELLADLQEERRMGLLLITHDLGVSADVADRIAVMYHGRIVEQAGVEQIYAGAAHPYTRGLLASVPRFDRGRGLAKPIPGTPPGAGVDIPGCAFHPRCPRAQDICRSVEPLLEPVGVGADWASACHFALEVAAT
jgi:oligopeptide transport system ATP-binding protein